MPATCTASWTRRSTTTARGLWTVKWSFIALVVTALLQLAVVVLSNSVALMADTIHNVADAATAIPLSVVFVLAPSPDQPTLHIRTSDGSRTLPGLAVVLTIAATAAVAGYVAIQRLLHPQRVSNLGAIVVASIIGFVGNEAVAIFRIRVGRQIDSAALVADGYHARTDGWTSLAVLVGAVGVRLGYPMADPIIGLVITVAILGHRLGIGQDGLSRMLDGVEPEVIDHFRAISAQVQGVTGVTEVRARWLGHRLRADIDISVRPELRVDAAHEIAQAVERQLQYRLHYVSGAMVHVAPAIDARNSRQRQHTHPHDNRHTRAH